MRTGGAPAARWAPGVVRAGDLAVWVLGTVVAVAVARRGALVGCCADSAWFAVVRVALAAVVVLRTVRLRPWLVLVTGWPDYARERPRLEALHRATVVLGVLLALGVATPVVAATLFGVHVWTYSRAHGAPLEEAYLQVVLLHAVALDLGATWSVDAWVGVDAPAARGPAATSLFLALGVVLLEAAWEKTKSPMWRDGDGLRHFLSLPHLALPLGRRAAASPTAMWVGGWAAVALESGLLLSGLHPVTATLWSIGMIGFGLSLLVLVDLSFISQAVVVSFALLLVAVRTSTPGAEPASTAAWLVPATLASATLLVSCRPAWSRSVGLLTASRFVTGISSQVDAFTETNVHGIHAFRLVDAETGATLLPAFDERGGPGPLQRWYPRQLQTCIYPLTEFCVAWTRHGVHVPHLRRRIEDLAHCAWQSTGRPRATVEVHVKGYDASTGPDAFLAAPWHHLATAEVDASGVALALHARPPAVPRCDRAIDRHLAGAVPAGGDAQAR